MPPPSTGLVQHLRNDLGITLAGGRVAAQADQSAYGQDVAQASAGDRPYMLGGDIDGIQVMTFGVAGDANKSLETAANFKDRTGTDMTALMPRTVVAVVRPAFDAAWGRTGGKIWSVDSSFVPLFELRSDFVANGAYAWEHFIDDYANALQFGPVTGGSGGPYDGVPTLLEWRSSGSPDFSFLVNNVPTATTPSVLYGSPTGVGHAVISAAALAFLGGYTEILVYDYDLGSDPGAHSALIAYLAGTYPSLGLPVTSPTISPRRTVATPGGRVAFSATGGAGGYAFSFVPGGNRSGGTIDPTTGAYQAGQAALGQPVDDLVLVTDSAFATDEAEVSVTGTLYRAYQSKTPAGRKGPALRTVEQVFGGEKDIQFERARQASLVGLPGLGPPDQLDPLGEDRMLPRAVSESPADDGGGNDQAYGERLRMMWTADDGPLLAGGHEGMLRELARAGFPFGDPAGAHVVQRTRLISWWDGAAVQFGDHAAPWYFDGRSPALWNQFGILFGADFTPPGGGTFADGDPSAALLNGIVRRWKPPKMRYMGAWVVVSGPTWGFPLTETWGGGGLTWGGASTRYVSPG